MARGGKTKGGGAKSEADDLRVIATNRKARHEYELLETFEAGVSLVGTEVKALRDGRCDLSTAYAAIEGDEVWIKGLEIGEYEYGNRQNHEPRRKRKLLLHRREIRKLQAKTRERGFTVVALRLYFRKARVKVEIALARGRKLHDRRDAKAKREAQRDIARALGRRG